MKTILVLFFAVIALLFKPVASTFDAYAEVIGELWVTTLDPNTKILVSVTPVGAVMNGRKMYSLECRYPYIYQGQTIYDKIYGGSKVLDKWGTPNGYFIFQLNHDEDWVNETDAAIGYGLYKISIYLVRDDDSVEDIPVTSRYVDFSDSDYELYNNPGPWQHFTKDLPFYYNNGELYLGWTNEPAPEIIQMWDQRLRNPSAIKTQNKDGFVSDNTNNPNWKNYPIDANALFNKPHISPSEFYVNLKVQDQGMNVIANRYLTFQNANLTFTDGIAFTVNSGGTLNFNGNSRLKTQNKNGFVFRN